MKHLFVISLLLIGMSATAQKLIGTAADIPENLKLILSSTKTTYHLVETDTSKSGKSIRYNYSNNTHKLWVDFLVYGEKVSLGQIVGVFEDVFPYWKKYIHQDDTEEFVKSHKAGHPTKMVTNGKNYIVCSFTYDYGIKGWSIFFSQHESY